MFNIFKKRAGPNFQGKKEIIYRGGLITFNIPAHWKEEYEEAGGGAFYDDRPDSGTLRLYVTTMKKESGVSTPDVELSQIKQTKNFQDKDATFEILENNNILVTFVYDTVEDSTPITIYTWVLYQFLQPDITRYALFTYTILKSEASHVASEVELIDSEVRAAVFSEVYPAL